MRARLDYVGHKWLFSPYYVKWRRFEDEFVPHEEETQRRTRVYTFEALKAFFPHGRSRRDLKSWLAKAHKKFNDGDDDYVKFDGARKDATLPTPVTATPGLVWRFPYEQEANRKCAFNAVKNIGYALPDEFELADLRSIVDYLMKNNIAQVLHLSVVYVLNIGD